MECISALSMVNSEKRTAMTSTHARCTTVSQCEVLLAGLRLGPNGHKEKDRGKTLCCRCSPEPHGLIRKHLHSTPSVLDLVEIELGRQRLGLWRSFSAIPESSSQEDPL